MRYFHKFTVDAPYDDVVDFHRDSASMGAITPPPILTRVQQAPPLLAEGDDMLFTLWMGPLPLRWHARIEDVTPDGFTDRQVSGPFKQWQHRHTFARVDDGSTIVYDEIEIELDSRPAWRVFGAVMVLNLPILFAFRGWKTRRLLTAGDVDPMRTPSPSSTQSEA